MRWFNSQTVKVHSSQRSALSDMLIKVDESDRVLGQISKIDGHLSGAITDGITHRAFSVFMFSRVDCNLLIQKRASTKIVFPRQWANTCCSHPLYIPDEMDTNQNMGVKRAASKRVHAELGLENIPPESFSFKDKILYRQMSPGGVFGESEVDYILFRLSDKPDQIPHDADEVEETRWISPGPAGDRTKNLRDFLNSETKRGFPATPWFSLMVKEPACLEEWWSDLIEDPQAFLASQFDNHSIRSFLQ